MALAGRDPPADDDPASSGGEQVTGSATAAHVSFERPSILGIPGIGAPEKLRTILRQPVE
jgi:hypothetical protein